MSLFLVCVFGVSLNSPGTEKAKLVHLNPTAFEAVLFEDGNDLKKAMCTRIFRAKPDLAWVEVSND